MTALGPRRLKALEEDNVKLRKLLAEQMLDIAGMKGLLSERMTTPVAKRLATSDESWRFKNRARPPQRPPAGGAVTPAQSERSGASGPSPHCRRGGLLAADKGFRFDAVWQGGL